MLLDTCPRAVVRCVLCALSGFAAPGGRCCLAPVPVPWLWPAACLSGVPHGPAWCAAPRPVRSLSVLQSAFVTLWCLSPPRGLAPPALLAGCVGHAEAGREPGSLSLPLATARAGALASLRVVSGRGPSMGWSLAAPCGVGLGLLALRWLACLDPVTDASRFRYRQSFDGGLGRCRGAVSCGRRHPPLWVGGRHAPVPCVCACGRPCWPGRAGRPPGRVLVRLTFSSGRFVFLLCSAPCGLGLPLSWSFVCPTPPPFFSPLRCCFPRASFVSWFLWFPSPGAPSLGAVCCLVCSPRASRLSVRSRLFCVARLALGCSLVVVNPPPFCVLRFPLPPLGALRLFVFFLPTCLRPRCLRLSLVTGPGCPGPWRCALFFFSLAVAFQLSVRSRLFCVFCLAVGCSLVVTALPPPPLWSLAVFVAAARCLFFSFLSAPPLSLAFSGFRPGVPWALALCFVCFVGLPLLGSPCALASFVCPAWPLAAPRWSLPPPPFFVSGFSSLPLSALLFFSSSCLRPRCLWLSLVSGPGCPGPWRCVLFALWASRFSALHALLPLWFLLPGRWLLPGACCPPPPPPPFCVSRFSSLPLGAVCRVLCCAVCPWVLCCAVLLRVVLPGVVLLCALLFCCTRLVPLLVVPCPLALPLALGPCALRRCVLQVPPRCGLCAV